MNTKDIAILLGKTKPTPEQALKGLKEVYTLARRNSEIIETERTKRKAIEAQREQRLRKLELKKSFLESILERLLRREERTLINCLMP